MAGSMKEKGILRAQAVAREQAKRFAGRHLETRHGSGPQIPKTKGRVIGHGRAVGLSSGPYPGKHTLRREAILRSKIHPGALPPSYRKVHKQMAKKVSVKKPISRKLYLQATESRLRLLRGSPKVESYAGHEKATSRLRLRAAHRGISVHPAKASRLVSSSERKSRSIAKKPSKQHGPTVRKHRAPLRGLAGKEASLTPPKVTTAAKRGGRLGGAAKSFAKSTGKHFAKFASSGAGKALGAVAKKAGPVGLALGAAEGAWQIGKAIGHGAKAIVAHRDLDVSRKKSKSKYGTLAAAARTRKAMTGK